MISLLELIFIVVFLCPDYKHGVQLTTNLDNRVLITFCASNEADRMKFVEDLNEAIMEVCHSVIPILL